MIEKRCAYCGVTATCFDHVPPIASYPPAYQRRRYKNKKLRNLPGVNACAECNKYLSDIYLLSIKQRAAFLHEKYQSKYKSLLNFPHWTQTEIEELEYDLRSTIVAKLRQKAWVQHRLAVLNCVAYPTEEDELNEHICFIVPDELLEEL